MTRLRRDPRAERAASAVAGAMRPRFALGAAPGRGRPRRDPRTDVLAQQVASPGRPRLDRAARATALIRPLAQPHPIEDIAPTPVIVDDPAFLVAVVPDAPGGRLTVHDRQLFGAARTLAGRTGAVIALAPAECEGLGGAGADRICRFAGTTDDDYDPDGAAAIVRDATMALSPRHVLFAETPRGGDLARRLTVLMDESLFCDIEVLSATSLARAARGRRVEQRCVPTKFITLAVDAAAPYAGAPREGRPQFFETHATAPGASAIVTAEALPADPASVPLALADFVTSAGNGIKDFDTFHRLVAALRATPGASRVLCDTGIMPRDAQVGASGTVLAATCYFALGIAGAPQHLQGVAGCEHVVAVNTDLHAAMIERAGLSIVQDAQLVMPALLAELMCEAGETT